MSNESSCDGCSLNTAFPLLQEFETVFRRESVHSRTPLGSDALGFFGILHLALAIVTFYRKSFTFSSHGMLCLSSGLVALLPLLPVYSLLLPPILTLFSLKQLLHHRHSLDFQDALNYSAMTLLLLLLSSPPSSSPWLLPIVLSPLQLIRKPAFLLRLLRPLRVAAGPVSIVSTVAIAGGQLKQDLAIFQDSYLPLLSILHALAVLIFATIAGVIFRPDNMSVLQLLVQGAKVTTEEEPTELERVESKGQLPLLTMCTQFVKDLKGLFPDSLLTSYNRRVEIHALANALVLLLCVVRATVTWLICVLFLQNL